MTSRIVSVILPIAVLLIVEIRSSIRSSIHRNKVAQDIKSVWYSAVKEIRFNIDGSLQGHYIS